MDLQAMMRGQGSGGIDERVEQSDPVEVLRVSNGIRAIRVTSGGAGLVASRSSFLLRYNFEVIADDPLSVTHPSELYSRKKA
jgi:hypothetical protein